MLCRRSAYPFAGDQVETCKQHSGEQVGGAETTSTGASDLEKMTKASTARGVGSVAACSDYESG